MLRQLKNCAVQQVVSLCKSTWGSCFIRNQLLWDFRLPTRCR